MTHLLIVDDHRMGAEATALAIRKLLPTFTVEILLGGQACLDRLAKGPAIDAILLDIDMPGISGGDVIRTILSRRTPAPFIIIPMSAWGPQWASTCGLEADQEHPDFKALVRGCYDKGTGALELVSLLQSTFPA